MAATASPPFNLEALGRFLAEASGAAKVEFRDFEKLTGGAIQENWGFIAVFDGGDFAGEHRLVLRTDATTGVSGSLGRVEEFGVLRAVHQAGVTVAEPLWVCPDAAVIGKPFFVMRRMPGTPQGREITADPTLELALPAVAARLGQELARIQTVQPPRPDLPFLAPESTAERIAGFRAYLAAHPRPRPVLEWAIRWLETHLPEPLPPVLCHRDFRTGNYLLDGAELTAVLDWEFAGWGDPDEEIGWLCCKGWRFARLDRELGGISDRAPFYDAYEEASGRRLDPARVHFWEVFANVRWAIIALQQSDRHLIGGARDLTTAIIGRRATECDLELLMLLDPGRAPVMGDLPKEAADIRDLPSGVGLLELGREWLLAELLPLVPPERHRELRLVATTMSIAAREAQAGIAPADAVARDLGEFYEMAEPEGAPTLTLPRQRGRGQASEAMAAVDNPLLSPGLTRGLRGREGPAAERWEGGGYAGTAKAGATLAALLQRFADDLRVGAFEACEPRAKAARAILWRLTILKLREGNPQFLAANGFGE